jgi:transketolase
VKDIDAAIEQAKTSDRPTLICCKTIIGKGAPNLEGGDKVHGAPLGDKEIAAVRQHLVWDPIPFDIPAELYEAWDAKERGAQAEGEWNTMFAAYRGAHPELASEFERRMKGELSGEFTKALDAAIASCIEKQETIATRKASQNAIQALAASLPEFLGGSADLTGSNLTNWKESVAVRSGIAGNHINYGVREFGMAAIQNGVALHGGFIPFGATFLTFSDYSRNALRMASLMKLRSRSSRTTRSVWAKTVRRTSRSSTSRRCA